MSNERDVITGNDAKAILDDKLFKGAFEAVKEYLDQQALSCDPDNKDKAARIIISKQLLQAVKRELERQVETGLIAQVQLSEIEKKRSLMSVFRR
jgi:hypothetical protein